MQGNARRDGRMAGGRALAALAGRRRWRAAPPGPRRRPRTCRAGDALVFAILRDGAPVGTHRLTFERAARRTVVRVGDRHRRQLRPLTVYRFAQRVAETWTGDGFFAIDSHTDDNGTPAWMHAERDASGSCRWPAAAPRPMPRRPGALASTYWNPAILGVPVISSQDGQLHRARGDRRPGGAGARGRRLVLARRSEMRGDPDLEIWYDLHARWAHLRLRRYGSVITYLRA